MTSIPSDILTSACLSSIVFIYLQALTFSLGSSLLPKSLIDIETPLWSSLSAYLFGFLLLSSLSCVLGVVHLIHMPSLLFCQAILWLIIFYRKQQVEIISDLALAEISTFIKACRTHKLLALILTFDGLMLLCCLLPPTKSDELTYHLYLTKNTFTNGGFQQLLSPSEILSSWLAVPIYNIWLYSLGAEFTPALNSFFYLLITQILVFSWSKKHYNTKAALFSLPIVSVIPLKFVAGIAPGDNTLNFLILLSFSLLVYEQLMLKAASAKNLLLINLLAISGLLVKLSSIIYTAPLLAYLLAFKARKVFSSSFCLSLSLQFLFLVPFFARNALLYENPIFPFAFETLGAGPFEYNALERGFSGAFSSPIQAEKNLTGLFVSPLRYLIEEFKGSNPNPFFWLCAVYGFATLFKKGLLIYLLACCLTYLVSFFTLPHYAPRFYLGTLEFLTIIGACELLNFCKSRKTKTALNFISIGNGLTVSFLLIALVYYANPFLKALLTNENRENFIQTRVDAYQTIQWANKNLPNTAKLLVNTRQRYYYRHPTESPLVTIFGQHIEIESDCKRLSKVLKENGVSHLLITYWGSKSNPINKRPLMDCLKKPSFAEEIYHNPKEIVRGHRWNESMLGESSVYKLL